MVPILLMSFFMMTTSSFAYCLEIYAAYLLGFFGGGGVLSPINEMYVKSRACHDEKK